MKFINKQAGNITLSAGDNVIYTAPTDAQIRAFTVYNPADSNIDITVKIGALQYVKKTVTAGATEIISQLFNQQIAKSEAVMMTGEGVNVLLTVVEITE